MNEVGWGDLNKTQRQLLRALSQQNRAYEANHTSCIVLERLGLIRRIGEPRRHRLMSHDVVEWAITEAGRARLQPPEAEGVRGDA